MQRRGGALGRQGLDRDGRALREGARRRRVVGVLMPDGVQADIEDAREIARVLGIRIVEVNIHAAVEGLRGALEASPGLLELSGTDGLTRDAAINMPARIRMTTLYAVGQMLPQGGASPTPAIFPRTGSATRRSTATPRATSARSRTFSCTRFARSAMRSDCPGRSSTKTPSDGLSGSTDEERLGFTYAVLDRYVLTGECPDEAVRARIDRLHALNLHKLRLMPSFEPAEDARLA